MDAPGLQEAVTEQPILPLVVEPAKLPEPNEIQVLSRYGDPFIGRRFGSSSDSAMFCYFSILLYTAKCCYISATQFILIT